MSRKIAIIGAANSIQVNETLLKMRGFEKWSINNLFVAYPDITFDRWFELHHFNYDNGKYLRRGAPFYGTFETIKEYMEKIDILRIPVFMQKRWGIIKQSRIFPFDQIMKTFHTEYFGCSFAWLIALALLEHLKGRKISEIAMLGIALIGSEYYYQRPSTEYWLGRAQGMGIKITIDPSSAVLKAPYIYAFKEDFDLININYVTTVRELSNMISSPMQEFFERLSYGKTAF